MSPTSQQEAFDSRGLVSATSAPYGGSETPVWTQFTYDAIGRKTQILHGDGTTVTMSYTPGRVVTTDERGNVKRHYYDAFNRLVKVEEVNGADTYVTTHGYDSAGSLTRTTNHLGQVVSATYDLVGRKTQTTDPNMGAWTYIYDAGGLLTSQTDARNQTLSFTYDLLGRMATKTYPGGAQATWVYDDPTVQYSKGRLTRVTDLAGRTDLRYDQVGRTTQKTVLLDATTYTMSWTYDSMGRVTTQTFPDTETLQYGYDGSTLLNSVTSSARTYVSNVAYDFRGQPTQIQYGNGVSTSFTYHATNFRATSRVTSGPGGSLQNVSYSYDNTGNITQLTDTLWTGTRTFTYDALNRLTSAAGTFGALVAGLPSPTTENYAFNAIGDITSAAGTTYTYGDPAHPSAVTSLSTGETFTYDATGNTITAAGRTMTWDADNQLSSATHPVYGTATFAYDYTGRRLKKTNFMGTARYPLPGYEIDPTGTITKFVVLGSQRAAAVRSTGAVLFYHNDHLGGINVVSNTSGARVQLAEYDPWGKVTRSEGTAETQYRFNGRELDDSETFTYYYGGRYYSAALRRFISADPSVRTIADPQSLNRYSYVENNPVNYTDPTGFRRKHCHGFWSCVGNFFERNAGAIAGTVAGAVVTIATGNPVIGAAVGIVVAGTVQGGVDHGIKGAALGGLAASGVAAGLVLGGVPGAIAGGAATGALSAELGGGDPAKGAAAGALSGAITGIAAAASVQGFGFSWGNGPGATITAQIANDAVRGFAVGTAAALVTGHSFGDSLEAGAESAAFTVASTQFNNGVGHAWGWAASGFHKPTYSNGAFYYDSKWGYVTIGNVTTGPKESLDRGANASGYTYRYHELGHVPQGQAFGLAYLPLNILSLGLSRGITGNYNQGNVFERRPLNPAPLYPAAEAP